VAQYSGIFTLSQASQAIKDNNWTGLPPQNVEYLVVAGGGGANNGGGSGGGGAGGLLAGFSGVSTGTQLFVTVGAGGAVATVGFNSVLIATSNGAYTGNIVATGGGLRTSSGSNCLQWGGGGGVNLTLDGAFNMNPANATIQISPTGTGTLTVNPATAGTINNMAIGGTTPAAGAFTTVTASTAIGIGSGGTGQTTAAAAITALTGTQTSGQYLRSNGTNAVLAAIQAGDVPTLNQNTTGTAAGLSSTLAVTSGGTGQSSALTQYGVVFASTTGAMATTTAGTAGFVLTSNGSSAPTFQAASGGLSRAQTTAISLVFCF